MCTVTRTFTGSKHVTGVRLSSSLFELPKHTVSLPAWPRSPERLRKMGVTERMLCCWRVWWLFGEEVSMMFLIYWGSVLYSAQASYKKNLQSSSIFTSTLQHPLLYTSNLTLIVHLYIFHFKIFLQTSMYTILPNSSSISTCKLKFTFCLHLHIHIHPLLPLPPNFHPSLILHLQLQTHTPPPPKPKSSSHEVQRILHQKFPQKCLDRKIAK